MTVTIFAASHPHLALDINHANFHWLMTTLQLSYDAQSAAMEPSEVMAACKKFWETYTFDHSGWPEGEARKVALWKGLIAAKFNDQGPIMDSVMGALGEGCNVVSLHPHIADLGNPLRCADPAYVYYDQMTGYVRQLHSMARHCKRSGQVISLF